MGYRQNRVRDMRGLVEIPRNSVTRLMLAISLLIGGVTASAFDVLNRPDDSTAWQFFDPYGRWYFPPPPSGPYASMVPGQEVKGQDKYLPALAIRPYQPERSLYGLHNPAVNAPTHPHMPGDSGRQGTAVLENLPQDVASPAAEQTYRPEDWYEDTMHGFSGNTTMREREWSWNNPGLRTPDPVYGQMSAPEAVLPQTENSHPLHWRPSAEPMSGFDATNARAAGLPPKGQIIPNP